MNASQIQLSDLHGRSLLLRFLYESLGGYLTVAGACGLWAVAQTAFFVALCWAQHTLFIDDSPGQSMLRIGANARRLKLRHQIKLVVIDYLQLIDPDNRRDSRQEQVANISRRLNSGAGRSYDEKMLIPVAPAITYCT